jgi:uncharacterized protein YggE
MNNKILAGIVIAAIVLIVGYLFFGSGPIVAAQGYASIAVQPDEASVYITIEERAQTAKEANNKASLDTEKLLALFYAIGIEKRDIQTSGISVNPEYDWSKDKQTLKGYLAYESITVKTKDFDKVLNIIDAAIEANATVPGINFEISQERENEYKAQALTKAGEDAKNKASAIAASQGKRIGRLVDVNSQEFSQIYPMSIFAASKDVAYAESTNAQARVAASSLTPSEQEITATINVRYRLGLF